MKISGTAAVVRCAVLGLFAGWVLGCAGEPIQPPPSSRTYTDPSTPIVVHSGESFTIRLPSNRTTGYEWRLARPIEGVHVKLVASAYEAPPLRQVGAGGEETWTFQALEPGKTRIALQYVRPWEVDVAPAKSVVFDVSVR